MAGMQDIRRRIKSVNETKQITKAMKLISASKLKKARKQYEATLPFFNKIQSTLKFILSHSDGVEKLHYFDTREEVENKKIGYIVITGDKGLCGGYNNNVIKLTEQEIQKHTVSGSKLFVVGNVGKGSLLKRGYDIDKEFNFVVQDPTFYRARDIADIMINLFNEKKLDEVYLIYTEMINTLKLEPKIMKLLPLEPTHFQQTTQEYESTKYLLTFEFRPSMEAVFEKLVPQYLRGIVYGALVQSFTSEQSARMTAMDSATRNAEELIQKLTLRYNRARQGAITQEILEIITGAETIK